ncbi:MAG TPA: magnesium/cobalt transporter CorA, partial [Planctomycetaceae bacterium]
PARIRTMACVAGVSLERGVPAEEVRDYIRDPANLVWMDVRDPGPAELSTLLEEFGFHPLALEDVARGQQRPKVDEYKGYLFVVVYGVAPAVGDGEPQTLEVDLFIGRNYVVSVHRGRVPAIDEALARWTRGGVMLRQGVGFLVYTLMDAIIDAYFPILDAIEDQVDEAELAMFGRLDEDCTFRLLRTKRTLVTLRRVLYPLRDIFHVFLRRDHSYFTPETLVYFQDVQNHVLRILDVVDIERERVAGAMEAYLAVVSNRLNRTMTALTFCTIAVGVIGAVFGAYGMNFAEIPLADRPWGFAAVAGGTVVLIGALLLYARRRGWF